MEKQRTLNLGEIGQIPWGQGRCFIIRGEEVAVFRSRSGRLFAIENRCPHRQGPLAEGVIGTSQVVCPLHGHKFDLATGKGVEPQECVKVFKVREEMGRIMLEYSSASVGSSNAYVRTS